MGACLARVQSIVAQEEYIRDREMHIQDLDKTMCAMEEVNDTRFRDLIEAKMELRKVTEENILLKQLMSDVSN